MAPQNHVGCNEAWSCFGPSNCSSCPGNLYSQGTPKSIPLDGTKGITREPKAYRAPDALDAVYPDVVKFCRYRKTAGNIENYPVQFDPLRKVAKSRLGEGCAFPETFPGLQ